MSVVDHDPVVVGTAEVRCPRCQQLIPVAVSCQLEDPPHQGDPMQFACTPDMTDLWAHYWEHERNA